ncbi:unnamed protein product [Callosobruchus maculatus]|uniref:Odorant receptor n=1 Tax=Callosobruchus maculatus TaxID=64391 RepID=A0A653CS61_CALMS|nr:unnamed protein product [Callosobruchus maculatus]
MNSDLVSLLERDILALKLIGFWKSSKDVSSFNSFQYRTYRVMFIQTTAITNPLMVVCIFFNMEHLHAMLFQLESAAFQPKSQNEYLCVYKWKKSCYLVKNLFYGVNGFLVTSGPILAMIQGKTAPIATYIPPWIHWRVYFWFQSTLTVYNATMASMYISTLTSLLIEAIIQVACLKERLQHTEETKLLVECIEHYLEIIMFTERLHQLCKIGLSIVFVGGVINICTTLSLLLVVSLMELLWFVPYLTVMIMTIYVHCFYGSILANECEDIPYALFSSKWVSTDVAHKRTLIIFMIFSKKQIYIKLAAGTLTMTLPLFVQIIRTAYAYFNVLQSLD